MHRGTARRPLTTAKGAYHSSGSLPGVGGMILRGGLCGAELHMCLRLHFTVMFPEYFTGTQDLVRVGDLR